MTDCHYIGRRLSYNGALCTVRYIGPVADTIGSWLGVEWDDGQRGKHAGEHNGVRYFACLSQSSTAASFVRPQRPWEPAQSFLSALREKYAAEWRAGDRTSLQQHGSQIEISGKVVEEVGFDKVLARLARLQHLKFVLLDGFRIAGANVQSEMHATCPSIIELDLSRNLLESVTDVVHICHALPLLRSLRLNGNRFNQLQLDQHEDIVREALRSITELALAETLLSWADICSIASHFESLTALNAGGNGLCLLPDTNLSARIASLTTVSLEYNKLCSVYDIGALASLPALQHLHLKGNTISTMTRQGEPDPPIFPVSLRFVDWSFNSISDWAFIDALPCIFPGLVSIRISHNPLYDGFGCTVDDDTRVTEQLSDRTGHLSDESFMFIVARVARLETVNMLSISPTDRANAETFYLSRVAKELAAVPAADEATVITRHPRFSELCSRYGSPDIVRRSEVNPDFLEARLVDVLFTLCTQAERDEGAATSAAPPDQQGSHAALASQTAAIPKSFDIYTVKGIAGRIFGLSPLDLELVWETGEWDPVGGLDNDLDDDSEDDGTEPVQWAISSPPPTAARPAMTRGGMWVKREVALNHGPRQLGFCVDGLEARIRVEVQALPQS